MYTTLGWIPRRNACYCIRHTCAAAVHPRYRTWDGRQFTDSKKIRWKMKDERGGWFAWAAMGLILPTSAKQMGRRESNRLIKMTQPNEHEWGEVYCTSTTQARTFRFRHIFILECKMDADQGSTHPDKKSLCSFVQPLICLNLFEFCSTAAGLSPAFCNCGEPLS